LSENFFQENHAAVQTCVLLKQSFFV